MPTTDPRWTGDTYNAAERFVLRYLKDERDMIFVRTATKITFSVFPLVFLLFLSPPWLVGILALPYIAYVFLGWAARYGLMLHATGHRPIFKEEYKLLGAYIPWVLGPLLGHTPTSFEAHHVFMHHAENNMLADASTTLPYKRDEITHFLHYLVRFLVAGMVHLVNYLWLRERRAVAVKLILGELAWFALAGAAMSINWAAGLVVFVIPMCIMRWALMCGNFGQHAFVDLSNPDSGFGNSTCLTNTRYNHKAYNDGYHIIHHLRPKMHWSEMAQWYDDHIDQFAAHDAIVFDGIRDNQHIWFLLMTKNYDKLASCLVDFRGRSHEEKIAFLKSRVHGQYGEIRGLFDIETAEQMQAERRERAALRGAA